MDKEELTEAQKLLLNGEYRKFWCYVNLSPAFLLGVAKSTEGRRDLDTVMRFRPQARELFKLINEGFKVCSHVEDQEVHAVMRSLANHIDQLPIIYDVLADEGCNNHIRPYLAEFLRVSNDRGQTS
jgi:hypothetical protein